MSAVALKQGDVVLNSLALSFIKDTVQVSIIDVMFKIEKLCNQSLYIYKKKYEQVNKQL